MTPTGGPPPLPDKAEERANAEAVALLKEHAINSPNPYTGGRELIRAADVNMGGAGGMGGGFAANARDAASTRTKGKSTKATPAPSMIQSAVNGSEEEYDLADYRSLRSTKKP